MLKTEKKIWDYIEKHSGVFFFALMIAMSIVVRYCLKDILSADAKLFLLPWHEEIKQGDGFNSLGQQVGNYNMPYQMLVAALTYLPINPLYAYKLSSCFFDYIMAFGCYKIVMEITSSHEKGAIASIAILFAPPVIFNSAGWAQCDSIYVSFIVFAILSILYHHYIIAFVFLGLSFAFKLQAIFILPFFCYYYYKKKSFSIFHFTIIPLVMCVASFPAIAMGRSIMDIFKIYIDQTNTYENLFLNYPSFWNIINSTAADYNNFKNFSIFFTAAILVAIIAFLSLKNVKLTSQNIIKIAFVTSYTCVLFLPAMHERYGYLYEVLAIIVACYDRKTIPLAISLMIITMSTYGAFLLGSYSNLRMLAFCNFITYLIYLFFLVTDFQKESVEKRKSGRNVNPSIAKRSIVGTYISRKRLCISALVSSSGKTRRQGNNASQENK